MTRSVIKQYWGVGGIWINHIVPLYAKYTSTKQNVFLKSNAQYEPEIDVKYRHEGKYERKNW